MTLPFLTPQQAESVRANAGHYGYRCFFGWHKKAIHNWPIGKRRPISRQMVCVRCGELLDIELLGEGAA